VLQPVLRQRENSLRNVCEGYIILKILNWM